jgi:hypothetical protein
LTVSVITDLVIFNQERLMDNNLLAMDCDELRELATDYPMEMDVIVEMLIDAEEDLCQES